MGIGLGIVLVLAGLILVDRRRGVRHQLHRRHHARLDPAARRECSHSCSPSSSTSSALLDHVEERTSTADHCSGRTGAAPVGCCPLPSREPARPSPAGAGGRPRPRRRARHMTPPWPPHAGRRRRRCVDHERSARSVPVAGSLLEQRLRRAGHHQLGRRPEAVVDLLPRWRHELDDELHRPPPRCPSADAACGGRILPWRSHPGEPASAGGRPTRRPPDRRRRPAVRSARRGPTAIVLTSRVAGS